MVRTAVAMIGLAATSANAVSDKEHTKVNLLKKLTEHTKTQQEMEIAQVRRVFWILLGGGDFFGFWEEVFLVLGKRFFWQRY